MSTVYRHLQSELSAVEQQEARFAWDQWRSTDYFYVPAGREFKRLEEISGNGLRALTIAVGECLCVLCGPYGRGAEALDYFDAAWACQVDPGRCEFTEFDAADWPGPANGALRAAMMIVNDAIFEASHDFGFALRGCWALNLLRHVLGARDFGLLEHWAEPVLRALERHHSDTALNGETIFSHHFTFGRPVGPRLFTLDPAYSVSGVESEMQAHLSSLRTDNPYRTDRP